MNYISENSSSLVLIRSVNSNLKIFITHILEARVNCPGNKLFTALEAFKKQGRYIIDSIDDKLIKPV